MMELDVEKVLNKYNNKRVDICWTGGVDSTLLLALLWDRVSYMKAISFDVRGFGYPEQKIAEAAARKRIKELMNANFGMRLKQVTVEGSICHRTMPYVYIQQPYIASMLPFSVSVDGDEVLLSYIFNDAVHYFDKLVDIYRSTSAFLDNGTSLPKLSAPLLQVEYSSLFNYARRALPSVFNELMCLTMSCESPGYNEVLEVGTACGKCAKCKKRIIDDQLSGSLIWDRELTPEKLLKLLNPSAEFVTLTSRPATLGHLALRKFVLTCEVNKDAERVKTELEWIGLDRENIYGELTYNKDSFTSLEFKNANSVSA